MKIELEAIGATPETYRVHLHIVNREGEPELIVGGMVCRTGPDTWRFVHAENDYIRRIGAVQQDIKAVDKEALAAEMATRFQAIEIDSNRLTNLVMQQFSEATLTGLHNLAVQTKSVSGLVAAMASALGEVLSHHVIPDKRKDFLRALTDRILTSAEIEARKQLLRESVSEFMASVFGQSDGDDDDSTAPKPH